METPQHQTATDALRDSFIKLMNDAEIKHLLQHPSTSELERKAATSLPEFYTRMATFDRKDTITLRSENLKTSFNILQTLDLLYAYIINRASAFAILEGRGYIIRKGFVSASDAAFAHFLDTVESRLSESGVERGGMTGHAMKKALKAYRVVKEEPLKLAVQGKVGNELQKEEMAVVWFSASAEKEGMWDMAWEIVSKGYAGAFYGDEKYEF